jgi:UDP-N-acetylmuramate dehydrogenase
MNLPAALSERLAGDLFKARPLAPLTWLRVGGPAEVLFTPRSVDDLCAFLVALPGDVPVTPLGVGSNLIVRDGGVRGAVIRPSGKAFNFIETLPDHQIRAGTAALDAQVAKAAARAGIKGLEFLRTIPGAIGGALRMNAGCYGVYMADVFVSAVAIDQSGQRVTLDAKDMGFGYRSSAPPHDMVFIEATLQGAPGDPDVIEQQMEAALAKRAETQPVKDRTAGSTFRNPAGFSSTGKGDHDDVLMAWRLIDEAGCRGLTIGGAQMNPKHSNFLTNIGGATAADLENLGEEVRKRVLKSAGIALEWEIKRIGETPTT